YFHVTGVQTSSLPFWFAFRLSMGDVTRRGYRVTFDLDDYLKANPTERWLMYEKAINLGVMDVAEVRAREDLPPAEPAVAEPPVYIGRAPRRGGKNRPA